MARKRKGRIPLSEIYPPAIFSKYQIHYFYQDGFRATRYAHFTSEKEAIRETRRVIANGKHPGLLGVVMFIAPLHQEERLTVYLWPRFRTKEEALEKLHKYIDVALDRNVNSRIKKLRFRLL